MAGPFQSTGGRTLDDDFHSTALVAAALPGKFGRL
jgi:hypothetical protein